MYNKSNWKLAFELLDKISSKNKYTSKIVLLQHNDRDVQDLIEESPHTTIRIDTNDSVDPDNSRWKQRRSCDKKLLLLILAIFLSAATLFFIIHFPTSHDNVESSESAPLLNLNNENPKDDEHICDTPNCIESAANLQQSMDLGVNPCDNFYQYTCGNWAKHHPRPEERLIWRWQEMLRTQIDKTIQEFFKSIPLADEPTVINESRIMYKSCMNAGKQAESGKKLVEEYLSKRFGLPDILPMIIEGRSISFDGFDWITTIAKMKKTLDIDIIFEFDIIPHPTNVNQKEFKFGKPASEAVTSEKIKKYIDFLHPYSNDDVVDGLAKRILKIDKKFTTMLSHKMNDATDANMLDGRKQALNFVEIILNKPAQTDIENRLIIWNEDSRKYFDDVNDFISSASKTDVALYIWWKIVNEMVKLIEDHYDVSSQHLSAHCANEVNELMGIIMSYAIAQPDFHSATKPKVQRMMDEIRSSFHDLVGKSDWLSDETKARILEKSQAMKMNVGFPEWIFNDTQTNAYFGHIKFNENSFLENIIRIRGSRINRKLNSLTSTDDMDWSMMPTEVNAKNDYPTNTMTIPQAILQFPFYNLGLEALNFGATDLGHEFMHGFDSIGIQYDKDGNWNVGWLGIGDEYNKRTEFLIDQYNGLSMPNMNDHIDGKNTLDENIADNVGLLLAYKAYQEHVKEQGEEKRQLPGFEYFTNEQLFFIAYGNKWCYSMDTKDQSVEDAIRNDVHSPNEFRVNGVVANMKEFQQAFKCSTESKMVSQNVCQVW